MIIYERRNNQPFKWLLAAIIFAVVLGIPLADVFGSAPQDCPPDYTTGCCVGEAELSTAGLVDPISLWALAGGLGALYAVRLSRKKKAE